MPVNETDDRDVARRVLPGTAGFEKHIVEPAIVAWLEIVPTVDSIPRVDDRHGEGIAGSLKLVGPVPIMRLLVGERGLPLDELLVVVEPVAETIMRRYGVVADQNVGKPGS